jgi:hypothetical protein
MIFKRKHVMDQLSWPFFKFDWPPNKFPWSKRNEQMVLLWLSTKYSSYDEMVSWYNENFPNSELRNYETFISWLLPKPLSKQTFEEEIADSDTIKLLLFSYNCLEKSLLWHNPEYTWPSGLHYAIKLSRDFFKEALSNDTVLRNRDLASEFLGSSGWGDLGWLKHEAHYGDFIHTFYEVLMFSQNMNQTDNNIEIANGLAIKSKNALLFSVSTFWEALDKTSENEVLINSQKSWYTNILCNSVTGNWDCITNH